MSTSTEQLSQKLLSNAEQGRLAHFYILQGRGDDLDFQHHWVKNFVRLYWEKIEKRSLGQLIEQDADLLWIKPLNDEGEIKDYVIEHIKPIAQFLSYRALKSRRRFIVMESVHRLSLTVANRLLKTLEEPEGEVTFFWLNPQGAKLLPTLESRALTLFVAQSTNHIAQTPKLDEIKTKIEQGLTLSQFIEESKKSVTPEEWLIELIEYEQNNDGPAALKQELLDLIAHSRMPQILHQGAGPRLQWIYHYMTQRFRAER